MVFSIPPCYHCCGATVDRRKIRRDDDGCSSCSSGGGGSGSRNGGGCGGGDGGRDGELKAQRDESLSLPPRSHRHLHNRNPTSSFLSPFQRMMILAEIPPPDARYVVWAEFSRFANINVYSRMEKPQAEKESERLRELPDLPLERENFFWKKIVQINLGEFEDISAKS